ncbi:hypothetical protein ACQKOE_06240 [Novosphingobium sp. NPDC080210]|uniref:hypothetical protein n=1 Tax=unclassified Novosphingobium TaxID=2644732 RepID=UPI0035AF23C4
MSKLFFIIHAVVMTTLMGMAVTAVLTMGLPGWKPLALAAVCGFIVSIPVTWIIANKIEAATR